MAAAALPHGGGTAQTRKITYALLGGVVLSMQVLAGHPQYLFYSAVAVFLYVILRVAVGERQQTGKRLRFLLVGFAVLLVTGVLLSAVQLLPAVELTQHSVREGLTYKWVSSFSLPPAMLITLLISDFFGDIVQVSYWGKNYLWEMSVYIVCQALPIPKLPSTTTHPIAVQRL